MIASVNLQEARETTEVIAALRCPTKISQMRLSLGQCSVCRRFVSSFAKIVAPLNQPLKKHELAKFELDKWSEKQSIT